MLDVLIVFIYLQVASHKQLLTRYTVGSPEYNYISAVLKAVERLHRIIANFRWKRPMGQIQNRQKILDDQARAQVMPTIAMVSVLHPIRLLVGRIPLHPHMHLLPQSSLHILLMQFLT